MSQDICLVPWPTKPWFSALNPSWLFSCLWKRSFGHVPAAFEAPSGLLVKHPRLLKWIAAICDLEHFLLLLFRVLNVISWRVITLYHHDKDFLSFCKLNTEVQEPFTPFVKVWKQQKWPESCITVNNPWLHAPFAFSVHKYSYRLNYNLLRILGDFLLEVWRSCRELQLCWLDTFWLCFL